jgi:hypothetical protein
MCHAIILRDAMLRMAPQDEAILARNSKSPAFVMPGLDPGIHVLFF